MTLIKRNAEMKRTAIKRISPKKLAKLGGKAWTTFAGVMPADRLRGMDVSRSSSMPKPRKEMRKRNPEHQAKLGKRYQEGLRKYRASETWKVVEARCDGRCEFAIALDPMRLPQVLDVRIDRPVPEGYARACRRRRRHHHHVVYHHARFGFGLELPEDMLAGCPGCHEYVEAMKTVHR